MPSLSEDATVPDIEATISTLAKVGDTNGAKTYQKLLDQKKAKIAAASHQPSLREHVSKAFNFVRNPENKLSKAVTQYENAKEHLVQQCSWVQQMTSELDEAERNHAQLVRALNQKVNPEGPSGAEGSQEKSRSCHNQY